MSSDRLRNAMDRIDRALARIETQAALSTHASAPAGGADADLARRHAALQDSVAQTIGELDALIDGITR